jgi:hypothetical protein
MQASITPTRTRGRQFTLELLFLPPDHAEYESLVERLAFVDPVFTGRNNNGVPWVDERLPARAPVDSQILKVVPGAAVQIEPFWAVLAGGQDNSRPRRGNKTVSVDVVFLADGDEYADRAAVQDALGALSL